MHKFLILSLALVATAASLISVAQPIRDDLAAKNIADADSSDNLPYDAEVEWLQGDGRGAYIDTGVSLFDGDIEVSFAFTSYIVNGGAFGYCVYGNWKGETVGGLSAGLGCLLWQNSIHLRYHFYNIAICPFNTDTHTISTINNRIFFDELDTGKYAVVTKYNGEIIQPILLFCECSNGYVNRYSDAKIFSFVCGDVRDLIPVRFTNEFNQAEGGMYDRISGELFRNAGTGSFVIGPDKE